MSDAEVVNTLGRAESLRQAGRPAEAIALLERLAVSHGAAPGVWHALGVAQAVTGRHAEAAVALEQAVRVEPASAEALNNYGAVLLVLGRPKDAVAPLQRALDVRPQYPDAAKNLAAAWFRIGDAAATAGDLPAAAEALGRAIAARPDHAGALSRLGDVRRQEGDADAAVALFRRALAIDPHAVGTLNNLGEALLFAGRTDEALEPLERALRLSPRHAKAQLNLGCARLRQARVDEAVDAFERSLALDPRSPRAHMNYGMALLQRGDFARGWPEVEWRFQLPEHRARGVYHKLPAWRGEALEGKAILLHAEQGFGDAFQFVRYVPLVVERAGRGAEVLVGCRPQLRRLFGRIECVAGVIVTGEKLPRVDVQCPFMSLPMLFGTTLENIPARVPYLAPPPKLVAAWRERVAGDAGLKVGVAWAGNPTNPRDRYRSMGFGHLAPLAGVEGVTFYRLQLGGGAGDTGDGAGDTGDGAGDTGGGAGDTGGGAGDGAGPRLVDLTRELADWAETAALMMNLDLVISVDTAVAHLAGALARPTWTLLSAGGEWRWLLHRSDSPWYPTMRLFRQRAFDDWDEVVHRVADALKTWADAR